MTYSKRLPDRCRMARQANDWTQVEAACALGWHVNTVRKFESRAVRNMEAYVHLAQTYGVTLDWLVVGRNISRSGVKSGIELLPDEERQPLEQLIKYLAERAG